MKMGTQQLTCVLTCLAMAVLACAPPPPTIGPGQAFRLAGQKNEFKKQRPYYTGPLDVTIAPGLGQGKGFGIKSFKLLAKPGGSEVHPNSKPDVPPGQLKKGQGWSMNHSVNQHHERETATFFSPDDPDSLGGLQPYEGETVVGESSFGTTVMNGEMERQMETATLLVLPTEPAQTNVQAVAALFGGEVTDQAGEIYRVKFNLSAVDLSDLEETLRQLNQYNVEPITAAGFSSMNSVKTFKILADLITKHPDLVVHVGLNVSQEMPWHSPVDNAITGYDGHFDQYDDFVDRNRNRTNWLSDNQLTWGLAGHKGHNVEKAWQYGFGGGVTVAYIDQGFQLVGNEEFKRRIDFAKATNYLNDTKGVVGQIDYVLTDLKGDPIYHGMYSMAAGYAERDNKNAVGDALGASGTAPNANVIPMNCNDIFTYARAIHRAIDLKVDLIVLNQNWKDSRFLTFLSELRPDLVGAYAAIDTATITAMKAGIPMVVSAHNHNVDVSAQWTPSRLASIFPGIIVVGGLTNQGAGAEKWVDSNHGSVVSIWGPADEIYVSDLVQNQYQQIEKGGTSLAGPFVSGVAALILAAVKRMNNGQPISLSHFKEALTRTDRTVQWNGQTLKMVNAKLAVEHAVFLAGKNPRDAMARKYYGSVTAVFPGNKINFTEEGTNRQLTLLPASSSLFAVQNGPAVVVGWPLNDGRIEAGEIFPYPGPVDLRSIVPNDIALTSDNGYVDADDHPIGTLMANGFSFTPGMSAVFSGNGTSKVLPAVDGSVRWNPSAGFDQANFVLPLLTHGTYQVAMKNLKGTSNSRALEVRRVNVIPDGGSGTGPGSGKTGDMNVFVYNVDDLSRVYFAVTSDLTGIPLILEVPYGKMGLVELGPYLTPGTTNYIRLMTYNFSGGYTWGYSITRCGYTLKRYVAGTAGSVSADNQPKPNQWVFDKTISIAVPANGDICQAVCNFPPCSNCQPI